MPADPSPLHHRTEVLLVVGAVRLFDHFSDHRRPASRMEDPSLMTAAGMGFVPGRLRARPIPLGARAAFGAPDPP